MSQQDGYPDDWQEQGWCCRPCAVAAWRASPAALHRAAPLDGHENRWRCSCGVAFTSGAGFAICPASAATVNPDEVLDRMLAAARRRPGDPLAADLLIFHRLMLDRLPWPTCWEERRVHDVPVGGELAADGDDAALPYASC